MLTPARMTAEDEIGANAIETLLVEDNPGDVRLIQEALGELESRLRLNVVTDGHQALAFLRRQPPFESAPRPRLVLLDLNVPGMNGHEILHAIKTDAELRVLPVIVMTSSASAQDVRRAYQASANSYVTKAADFDSCVDLLRAIESFWLFVAKIP